MSSFTEPLDVRKVINHQNKKFLWFVPYRKTTHKWVVLRGFTYDIGAKDSGKCVDVPENFETDFASIPRVLWTLAPPDGVYTQASVLHDFLYFSQSFSRKRCDEIFLEAMGVLGVPDWKRHLIYKGVRVGGWYGWNKKGGIL